MTEPRPLRQRVHLLVRVMQVLVVVCLVVLVIGVFVGWFAIDLIKDDANDRNRLALVLYINRDAIWSSGREVREEAVGLKDRVEQVMNLETHDGVVRSVDPDDRQFTLKPDAGDVETFHVDDESEIRLGVDKTSLADLKTDSKISVTFVEDNGLNKVRKISLLDSHAPAGM